MEKKNYRILENCITEYNQKYIFLLLARFYSQKIKHTRNKRAWLSFYKQIIAQLTVGRTSN